MKTMELSLMPKTWVFDLDGTIVEHNGYKKYGQDRLLDKVGDFFSSIPIDDYILILTAREKKYKRKTISFLKKNNIRFNKIIFGIPYGERILLNDDKPSGLVMAQVINLQRDEGFNFSIKYNKDL
jgi:FMN phosphatase YigB (HAD superfamily)